MKRILFSLLFVLLISINIEIVRAGVSTSDEIRAVYLHRLCMVSNDIDWNTIAATMKSYKFNLCLIPAGTSSYKVSWWNSEKACMADVIAACHNNGMEAHILFGFLGSWNSGSLKDLLVDSSTFNEDYTLASGLWFDPCKNITREVIKNLTTELARDLDIDGFNFDYIRYLENVNISYSRECKAKFAQWLADQGKPPITEWPGPFVPGGTRYNEFMEWRVIPITELVRDTREWMLVYKPDLEFSASTYTYWYGLSPDGLRYEIGQDPTDWIAKGYLDFTSPMLYYDDAHFLQFKDFLNVDINYFTGGLEGTIPMVPFLCKDRGCTYSTPTPNVIRDEVNHSRYYSDGIAIWRYGGPGVGSNSEENGGELTDIRAYLNRVNETNPNGWFDTFSLQNIRVEDITDNTATIKWTTNLPTMSKIEYNTTPLFVAINKIGTYISYLDMEHIPGKIVEDRTNVTSHSITLTNLQKGILYYYRVQSQDNFGLASGKVLNFSIGGYINPVNITGTVTDSQTGSPIEDAIISCNDFSTKTNSMGNYIIKMTTPAPGYCSLRATKLAYEGKTIDFTFTQNKNYEMNFALEKIRYRAYGTLKNANNDPVRATIIAYEKGTMKNSTEIDPNGNYSLSLTPGVYDIQFNLTNFCIPNYYLRIPSVDLMYSEVNDMIKNISCSSNGNKISINYVIWEPKAIQTLSLTKPIRITQNGVNLKEVSSSSNLKNNTWSYENNKMYFLVTPWSVPVCGNGKCEIGEKKNSNSYYYCPEDCPIGLIGYWKFDDGSGSNAYDSSGYDHSGTLMGGLDSTGWTTSCKHGKCLNFDGDDDYVKINQFGDFSEGFSLEFWFKMNPSTGRQRPFLSENFATAYIDTGTTDFAVFIGDGTTWTSSLYANNMNYNSWIHFAMTYNASSQSWKLYRNGTSVASKSLTSTVNMVDEFHIGEGWGENFYGMIDEFAIYNHELTAEEVNQHYLNGISV